MGKFHNIMAVLATFTIIFTTITAANAADKKFDGFYVGAELGYDYYRQRLDSIGIDGIIDPDGVYYGGLLGWRMQRDNGLVTGAEARIGDSSTNITSAFGTDTVSLTADRQFGADFIAGSLIGPSDNLLLYVLVGYSNFKASLKLNDLTIISGHTNGVRVGGGLEYSFSNNVSVRITGVFTNYENEFDEVQATSSLIFSF